MNKDSIGIRMKENYELRSRIKLIRRIPVIMRLDGNVFHTLTKGFDKPFDEFFHAAMVDTAIYLCSRVIQGAKCAYVQSDEISILLTDFDRLTTEPWLDYVKDKMASISASKGAVYFTWKSTIYNLLDIGCLNGCFDSRTANYPKEEVRNYFVWRQLDWFRNSISMYAQSMYSHKELQNKNQADMHEMLHQKGKNWADLHPKWKNGTFIYKYDRKWMTDEGMIFTKDGVFIDELMKPIED